MSSTLPRRSEACKLTRKAKIFGIWQIYLTYTYGVSERPRIRLVPCFYPTRGQSLGFLAWSFPPSHLLHGASLPSRSGPWSGGRGKGRQGDAIPSFDNLPDCMFMEQFWHDVAVANAEWPRPRPDGTMHRSMASPNHSLGKRILTELQDGDTNCHRRPNRQAVRFRQTALDARRTTP